MSIDNYTSRNYARKKSSDLFKIAFVKAIFLKIGCQNKSKHTHENCFVMRVKYYCQWIDSGTYHPVAHNVRSDLGSSTLFIFVGPILILQALYLGLQIYKQGVW